MAAEEGYITKINKRWEKMSHSLNSEKKKMSAYAALYIFSPTADFRTSRSCCAQEEVKKSLGNELLQGQ